MHAARCNRGHKRVISVLRRRRHAAGRIEGLRATWSRKASFETRSGCFDSRVVSFDSRTIYFESQKNYFESRRFPFENPAVLLRVSKRDWIYDSLYCARGQAENLIKLHKTQLASDRTSCRSALANQVRLVLHTAAYWLMLTVRDAIPKVRELATAEFATLRLRLLKIAARVVETTSRIRVAFAAACPKADLIRCLPGALLPLGP
jgi:hypothetical protein